MSEFTLQPTSQSAGNLDDHPYRAYVGDVQQWFSTLTANREAVFKTDVGEELFDLYLAKFPAEAQKHNNCSTCRHFFKHYGDLVIVDHEGVKHSALWNLDQTPDEYKPSIEAVLEKIQKSKIVSPFHSEDAVLGQAVTNQWAHPSVTTPEFSRYSRTYSGKTPGQFMAKRKQDFLDLTRTLAEYPRELIDQAVTLLGSSAMGRAEKVAGPGSWLQKLSHQIDGVKDTRKVMNLIWKAVAKAPEGWCQGRSGMFSTILDDLRAGTSFEVLAKKFNDKMDPTKYLMPTAAPTDGAVEAAEKKIALFGLTQSLERRIARLDEITYFWKPKPPAPEPEAAVGQGLFSYLKSRKLDGASVNKMTLPMETLTWVKFVDTVLPTADKIEYQAPYGHGNFIMYTTAVHPDAPPILQWDYPDNRNPVAWYAYKGGVPPQRFGLESGQWYDLVGLSATSASWNQPLPEHFQQSVTFVMAQAIDTAEASLCLFPEILQSRLHDIRSVIAAHSNANFMALGQEGAAGGAIFFKAPGPGPKLRVTVGNQIQLYQIDRWD